MEAIIASSVDDTMISPLSFALPLGASYLANRRSVSYRAVGSNRYSPTSGIRLIKFVLASDDYLDPSTLQVGFDVVNDDANAAHLLRPLSGPHIFFRRMRILCGGAVIEDIEYYNRVHELFQPSYNVRLSQR